MRSSKVLSSVLSALVFASCEELLAQFYAPDTEYHDPVQRVFVVESARVLAWVLNREGSNIAQVAYTATTRTDNATTWEIRWLDAAGKPVKTARVSYPASSLKEGVGFYRSVFKQLWMADWRPLPGIRPQDAASRFWQGAAQMGISRESSLGAAFELARGAELKSSDEWIPKLAGLLIHTSLPGVIDHLSLDRVVLARGAAWLALAEQASATSLESLWAPVLFQAGRERAAAEIWNKGFPSTMANATAQQAGWNLWLRKPASKGVYLFAAESANLPMAMPMLAYNATVNQTGSLLADLIEPLAGGAQRLPALHNYAPLFALRTSVSGGRILEGAWPVFGRLEWLHLLATYPATTNDYRGYLEVMHGVTNTLSKKPAFDRELDASLYGFREVVPLLRMGQIEGVGPLSPTAVATARDLLNYGWEMNGLQMGSRYQFVQRMWGVPSQAEPILKTVTGEVDGLMPFFLTARRAGLYNYDQSLQRLQLVDGLSQLVGFSPPAFGSGGSPTTGPRLFVKRCWLRPREFAWQVRALWGAKDFSDVADLILALQDQGSALAAEEALRYLVTFKPEALRQLPRGEELKYDLAGMLPEPTRLYVQAVSERKLAKLTNFDRAREIEKLYWQNPDSQLEDRVFRNYIVSDAHTSARRFYLEARENLTEPVGFSNGMGKMVYVMGFLLNDASLRNMALEDSRSGSNSDITMHVWDAAIRDDGKELEQDVKDLIERYEENQGVNSQGRRLLNFLPLLPALRDPRHPSHPEALRYFGKDPNWAILRWIWIQKLKLPTAEAITLLGGQENDLFRRVLICYLENNAAQMLDALNQLTASQKYIDERTVLAASLYYKLHPLPAPGAETDLKPAGAISTRKAVMAKLKATRG